MTVLIPVYNGLAYLPQAIESVLVQTFSDFELLIVDDASADGSVDCIRSYADPRIRWISNERNRGQAFSLNKGLSMAGGEYVARLDQDDRCLPNRLKEQVEFLDAHPDVACVGTWQYWINPEGRKTALETGFVNLKEADRGSFLGVLLTQATPIGHPTVMFRRDLIRALNGYDETFSPCEDYELWCRLALRRHRVGVIPRPLVMLRLHSGQQSAKKLLLQQSQARRAHDRLVAAFCREKEQAEGMGRLLRAEEPFWRERRSLREVWAVLKDIAQMLNAVSNRLELSKKETFNLRRRVYGWLGRGALLTILQKKGPSLPVWWEILKRGRASARLMLDTLKGRMRQRPDASPRRISIEQLKQALQEVKNRCPHEALLILPWMQVRHPIHPVQEELMSEGESQGSENGRGRWKGWALWQRTGRFTGSVLYAGILCVRLFRLQIRFWRLLSSLRRQPFDLVAKTWVFTRQGKQTEDFYYGNLPSRLQERGIRMLLLFGDPAGGIGGPSWVANASEVCPWRLPELCLVPLLAPFQMVARQGLAFVNLRRFAGRTQDPLLRRIAIRASEEILSRQITPMGLAYWWAKRAVQIWGPKAFVTLYEGHGWEPLAWIGAKQADPACEIVGYQHTILLRHNLELLQPQESTPASLRPGVILCLGPRTQAMLESSHPQSVLIPFGSFRRQNGFPIGQGPAPEKRTVIVLPEGLPEEELLLFNSATRVARVLPEYRFIFRCHPVLPFERIRGKLKQDPQELPNVELSLGRSIEEDYARSSVILYRGTSSVLMAVLHGLKPVYLHLDGAHEVDPLFELQQWRQRISSVSELERSLDRYAREDPEQHLPAWRQAVEYVNSYAVAVNDSSIDRFLESVGLR